MTEKLKQKLIAGIQGTGLYNRPLVCPECQEDVMVFQGGGSYLCPKCGTTALDDWGRVREYLYANKGATAQDIEKDLGIPRAEVNQMLRESKIQFSEGLKSLTCDMCGRVIKSGRLCPACEKMCHQTLEEKTKRQLYKQIRGMATAKPSGDAGKMRFSAEE